MLTCLKQASLVCAGAGLSRCLRAGVYRMRLEQAGWNEAWVRHFASYEPQGLLPARVLAQHRHSYTLWTESGEADAEVAGALLYRAGPGDLPAVGDWAAMRQDAPGARALITQVLPRITTFSGNNSGPRTEDDGSASNIDLRV